jgi:hypothetical protein
VIAALSLFALPDPGLPPESNHERFERDVGSSRSFVVFSTPKDDLTVIWLLDSE